MQAAGYHSVFSGQKTYNGVAILSRAPAAEVQHGIPDHGDDQKRVIAATFGDVRVVCVYVPNGQAVDSDKYYYKLGWLDKLRNWLKDELTRYPKLAVLPPAREAREAWRARPARVATVAQAALSRPAAPMRAAVRSAQAATRAAALGELPAPTSCPAEATWSGPGL